MRCPQVPLGESSEEGAAAKHTDRSSSERLDEAQRSRFHFIHWPPRRPEGEEPSQRGEEPSQRGEEPSQRGEEPSQRGEEPSQRGEEPSRTDDQDGDSPLLNSGAGANLIPGPHLNLTRPACHCFDGNPNFLPRQTG